MHPIIQLDNLLNPTNISMDNFKITLTGSPISKTQQLYELQCFESKLMQSALPLKSNQLPRLLHTHSSPTTQSNFSTNDSSSQNTDKNNITKKQQTDTIRPNSAKLQALLAADLAT